MRATQLGMAGLWVFEAPVFLDDRGTFAAPFQREAVRETTGFDLTVAQVNRSVSRRGAIRGLQFADVPPGQGRYVYCSHGALLDVIVDIRVGSPTFGTVEAVELDAAGGRAVYLSEGLGHAFVALQDRTCVTYLCSTPYRPESEHGVHPFDPALALPWPANIAPILSPKDSAAPSMAQAREAGLLPDWNRCLRCYDHLKRETSRR